MAQAALSMPSHTSSEDLSEKLKPSQIQSLSTKWNLPRGWEHYFAVRGNGQLIICPACHWRPGTDVPHHRRWKVLSNHMAVKHRIQESQKPGKLVAIKGK